MGVSRSPEELAAKLHKYGATIEDTNDDVVGRAAFITKTRILGEVAKAVGGDHRMGTKRIGVRYKVAQGTATVRGTGPMHWLERGVKPHAIAPKGAGGSRATRSSFVANAFGSGPISFGRGRIGVLRFADGSFRPYARAAGRFPAKQSWSNGVEAAERPVKSVFKFMHGKALARSF